MSEQSAKPYLVRAICEWCADNGLTPYLAVKVNPQTRVPVSFVKNGEIGRASCRERVWIPV